jgi:tRNA(Ile)-lysidine synthetase-like protein
VREFATERTPTLEKDGALIAVSGGADSISTAALLCEAGVINPAQATVAHFDHRMRGVGAAERDRLAVEALCARYGLKLLTGYWRDPRPGEARARDARYAFLREAAGRARAQVLVTGHTSDDQAETVLMHAMRGAGLHGLRGIRPQSIVRGISLVRPMLCVSRSETREYCGTLGLTFVEDATNEDTSLLRNKVRAQLLPAMEAASPGARDALLRTARDATEAVIVIEAVAATAIGKSSSEEVVLPKERLRSLPEAFLPYALRLAVERLTGDVRELDRRHYAQLTKALAARTGAVLQLPTGLSLHAESAAVVLTRSTSLPAIPSEFAAPAPFTGTVGAWDLHIQPVADGALAVHLPPDAVVRRRRPGDRIQTHAGSRKLQDFFVDRKVPRRERDAIPLIASGCRMDAGWCGAVLRGRRTLCRSRATPIKRLVADRRRRRSPA